MIREEQFFNSKLTHFIAPTTCNLLKPGHPALFFEHGDSVSLFEEPTQFLNDQFVIAGATPSVHTWAKAVYSLKSWFVFLQVLEIYWTDATRETRRSFRDAYTEGISPKTGQLYGAKGISDAMSIVRSFYAFSERKNWYTGDLGSNSQEAEAEAETGRRKDQKHSQSATQTKRDRDLPKIPNSEVIRPLSIGNLRKLLHYIGPSNKEADDTRESRDRLAFDLGWVVGLRLDEVINLSTLQFLGLDPNPDTVSVDLSLTVLGKGKKQGTVAIPTWLVLDIIEYIDGERKDAIEHRKNKTKPASLQLFVGKRSSLNRTGLPIGADAIQKIIRTACLSLGIVSVVHKKNLATKEGYEVVCPKHSFHDLRHTFAVCRYHVEVALGNPEPWKKIQAQLRHRYLSTTTQTYLSHVEIFNDSRGVADVRKMLGL